MPRAESAGNARVPRVRESKEPARQTVDEDGWHALEYAERTTTEQEWQEASPWRDAPALSLDADRLIVIAAGPGDETLGAGGLLSLASRNGLDVSVLVVTDGAVASEASAARRQVVDAVHALAPSAVVSFYAVPADAIRDTRALISERVGSHIAAGRARRTIVAAPWWADGDRDHQVLGNVARAFTADAVRVIGYPMRAWQSGDPAEIDTTGWRILALDAAATQAKRQAVVAHAGLPGLHTGTRALLDRAFEIFVEPEHTAAPSWSTERFDAYHAREDPWGLDGRWYERRKRALLMASLPRERFRRALELGCSTGPNTRAISERADAVLGIDSSQKALDKAIAAGVPANVTYERMELPAQWPSGAYDLIVLSEVAYYWTPEQFGRALDLINESATDDAVFIACHWRKTVEGTPLTGDDVHAAISARPEWRVLSRHIEDDFLMDVVVRHGVPNVSKMPDA